jgi:serine/threonine-protein kinase HipA
VKRAPDTTFLWYLADPRQPRLVGTLRLVLGNRSVSLRYGADWLAHGFPISEDLPLVDIEHAPAVRDEVVGAVEDARPDRWGERVIEAIEKPARRSLMEYLLFAGHERFGAFSVSTSDQQYVPYAVNALPGLQDVDELQRLVRLVAANEPVPVAKQRLLAPGTSMGGARPKALIDIDGAAWIVKFAELGDPADAGLVEHAAMTLAAKAGIRVAPTRAIRLQDGHAVAIQRFDRARGGARIPAQSAFVALRAEGSAFGYPELAALLRRRAAPALANERRRELFRRMVFNILIDNTDDHEKNHALMLDDRLHVDLAPAFDVLPTAQGLGYQQMRVGAAQADSTIDNALSEAAQFGLSKDAARREAAKVARVCAGWREHFAQAGVSARDIDYLAVFIDREFLKAQRDALVRRR